MSNGFLRSPFINVHIFKRWSQFSKITVPITKILLFLKFIEDISPFLWGHRYPCFGLLVTSALGFRAMVDPHLRASLPVCNYKDIIYLKTCRIFNTKLEYDVHLNNRRIMHGVCHEKPFNAPEMNPCPLGLFYHYFLTPVFFVRNAIFANRYKVVQIYGPWERLITKTQDVTYSGWAKSFTTNRLSGKECQHEWAAYREPFTLANRKQFNL